MTSGPSHRRSPRLLVATSAALALVSLSAIGSSGVAGPASAPAPESEPARRTRVGREALKAGKAGVARHHFLDALAVDPSYAPVWNELASLDATSADAKALWALGAAFALTDATGRVAKVPLGPPFAAADVASPLDLASKRAALARAITEAAGKLSGPGGVIVAKWLRWLADETANGAASLGAPARAAAEKALDRCRPEVQRVRTALEAVLAEAKAAQDLPRIIEAARLLVGFASQRRGVRGTRAPIADGFGARRALDEAREALAAKTPPMSFDDLEKLFSSGGRRAFEDAHSSWTNPIVVASKDGRYRIESVCGLATTHEAAILIERCHDRLVAWCGKDPFVDGGGRTRLGVVRLCPTDADLEQEGAPYWWAAGFASGDVVTVAAHWSTSNELSQLLAHELTHRFDQALFPGLPAWASEGRATYVGATTPYGRAQALDERHINFRDFEVAYRLVAWSLPTLLELLSGRDPEYRHNYPVGYSLWTFLSQWTGKGEAPTATPIYRALIPALLAALRQAPGMPVDAFEASVCDGKKGRAADMKGFAKQFADFLDAFYKAPEPPWTKAWRDRSDGAAGHVPSDAFFGDRSNQPLARDRLDPPAEGEALAALAAEFLERVGRAPDALDAHALADAVDEIDAVRYAKALALEATTGRKEAVFARTRLLSRVRPGAEGPAKPDVGGLAPLCAIAASYLDALSRASSEALAASRPRMARALRAEHDRMAPIVGRGSLGEIGLAQPSELEKDARDGAPDCVVPVSPFGGGVIEERWSAQEDGAVAGLYGLDGADDLVLGRKAGGAATTGLDADASWSGVAVHGKDVYVGTYTIRARVRIETTFVTGRVVVGWTRRDRGVEVTFRAGEREPGAPASDTKPALLVSLSDLRTIDRRLSNMSREAPFGAAGGGQDGFELTLHVAGPYVRVQVDGIDVLSMRRTTGEPIEGFLGFAADRGRVTFASVRVARHRSLGHDVACRCGSFDAALGLTSPNRFSWTSLVGRRVVGLAPSPHARLLLWSTGLSGADPTGADSIHTAIKTCREPFVALGYPLDVHVAAKGEGLPGEAPSPPSSFPQAGGLQIPDGNVHVHHGFPGLDADVEHMPQNYEIGWPAWGGLFVDPSGVIRARGPIDELWHGVRLARFLAGH